MAAQVIAVRQEGHVLQLSPKAILPDEWQASRWAAYVAEPTVELRLVRCAWCQVLMGLQAVPAGGEHAGRESHACCARCAAAFDEEGA